MAVAGRRRYAMRSSSFRITEGRTRTRTMWCGASGYVTSRVTVRVVGRYISSAWKFTRCNTNTRRTAVSNHSNLSVNVAFRNNDYESTNCLRETQYILAKKKTDLRYQKWSFIVKCLWLLYFLLICQVIKIQ